MYVLELGCMGEWGVVVDRKRTQVKRLKVLGKLISKVFDGRQSVGRFLAGWLHQSFYGQLDI